MGLFNFKQKEKKEKKETPPRNPNTMVMIRLLAVGYVLYTVWEIIKLYIAGGEDAPKLWMVILSVVVFVGGSVWIGWMTYKEWKRLNAAAAEAKYDDEDDDNEEDEDVSEDYDDDYDDYEDDFDDEE